MMRVVFGTLGIAALLAGGPMVWAQSVFINELHYENDGTDANEGVEIAGPAGTNLATYAVHLYNGNGGTVYNTVPLSGTIPNLGGSGFGAIWFPIPGIQNGDPDGLALVQISGALVVQRMAYEGSFTATSGPAGGANLPDIGVRELDSITNPAGRSLQLTGTGTVGASFAWTGPAVASPGAFNAGQTFGAAPTVSLLTMAPGLIKEGGSTTATLTLIPAPAGPVVMTLSGNPPGTVQLPASVLVPAGGTVTFPVTAPRDGVADGFQQAAVLATDGAAVYPTAGAALQVIDLDRPARSAPGVLRLMSLNVKVGIGAPGSAEFAAVREVIERISPDVLAMQEVSDAGEFGDALTLLEQVGFPPGAAYRATTGDAFAAQTYSSGDFGTGECVITASRYPITSTIQIGRGVAGRKELTRFPLYTRIDLPGSDLHLVNVHLKAGTEDPDRFRKAVEAYRIREFLTQQNLSAAADTLVVAGDFNAIDGIFLPAISYNTSSYVPPAGFSLPVSFQLGNDLKASPGITLPYSVSPYNAATSVYPHQGFNPAGLFAPALKQADGVNPNTFIAFGARFDYFMFPQRLQNAGQARGEVYNSRLEPQADGLPKRPSLPTPELSEIASDHHAVFLDLNLNPSPALALTVSPNAVDETSAAAPPVATVSLNPAPTGPVTVQLRPWRGTRVQFAADTVILTPTQPSAQVPVRVPASPLVEAQRAISLTATADGYEPAFASLTVRSAEAAGLLVFSQYVEPSTAATPPNGNSSRAIELYNASGQTLDLERLQWEVRRFTNGSASPVILGQVSTILPEGNAALLPPGQVVVVGEAAVGDALVAAGRLPAPSVPFANADPGTLYCHTSGQAIFLKGSNLNYNGNDALEIVADGVRCDVFGRIGQDPGTAWSGGPGNPSSADQNLSLRPEIFTGSTGFTLTGTRFLTTAAGNSLTGIGVPPMPTDRYFTWAAAKGLVGISRAPNSDPDGDGRLNLIEFIQETNPAAGDAAPGVTSHPVEGSFLTLNADAWLSLGWERSDLRSPAWVGAPEVTGTAEGSTRTRWGWKSDPATSLRRFWRLRAARP
jgi:endonuclease/exonuclease/phosphatase family metal-dependent hydrolase